MPRAIKESLAINYRGTIAYRSNAGAHIPEGFVASFIKAWDFLILNASFDKPVDGGFLRDYPNFDFMRGLSCILDESAHQIVQGFRGDWVLMLDTDHVFQSDAFYEMVMTFEENQLDILVGFTQKRTPPYHPVLYRTDYDPLNAFETIYPDVTQKQMLMSIDSSGAACLMVRRRVFDAIAKMGERPFLPRDKFPAGYGACGEKLPEGRRLDERYAEDTSFFWRAKMCGFQAWCAPWIKFYHMETRLVTEALYDRHD